MSEKNQPKLKNAPKQAPKPALARKSESVDASTTAPVLIEKNRQYQNVKYPLFWIGIVLVMFLWGIFATYIRPASAPKPNDGVIPGAQLDPNAQEFLKKFDRSRKRTETSEVLKEQQTAK